MRRRAEAFPAAEAKPETTPSPAPAPAKPEPVVAHLQSARLPADARLTRRPRKSRKSAFAGQT
ncbi:MAG: hypothetical protein NZM11_11265, partial [Anaerolineales bacterium]|nr:hypothetical protein [Anaerolineales bacterium]